MAKKVVTDRGVCIRVACQAFRISKSCYRYERKLDRKSGLIVNWPTIIIWVAGDQESKLLQNEANSKLSLNCQIRALRIRKKGDWRTVLIMGVISNR